MKKIFLLFILTLILSTALVAQDAETKLKEKGIVLIPHQARLRICKCCKSWQFALPGR